MASGAADFNFSAFALFLGAVPSQIGLLTAVPQLLGGTFQLWSERLTGGVGSRKRTVLLLMALRVALLIGMAIAALRGSSIWIFVGLAVTFLTAAELSTPVWSAWVSDVVPASRRGLFFGKRNQLQALTTSACLIVAGFLLDRLSVGWNGSLAFAAVFALGILAQCAAFKHLSRQVELRAVAPIQSLGPVRLARALATDREVRKMLLCFAAMGFAVSVSGPFCGPFLLKSLRFTYLEVAVIFSMLAISRYFFAPVWGRLVDRYGSRQLLTLSSLLMALVPVGWCLSTKFIVLLAVQIFSGFVWAGLELCAMTYIIESTTSEMRGRVFAGKQLVWNVSAFCGALAGGLVLGKHGLDPAGAGASLSSSAGASISMFAGPMLVFWLSGLARGLAAIPTLRLARSPAVSFTNGGDPAPAIPRIP